jgi:hypothetical protein
MHKRTLGALLLAGVLAIAGCGGTDEIAEQAVEEASGGEVKIDKDGDETKIEVGGQKLENKQGGLVDGFPEDFPLPDDFDVSSSSKTQGKYQAFGSMASSDDTFAFYKAELRNKEWKIQVASAAAGDTFQILASKDGREAVLNSRPANEGAHLTVVVE